MRPPFEYRMAIMVLVGGCVPPLITHSLMYYLDISWQRAAELTFIICIPLAIWLASKINERWHDDRED